MSTVEILSLAFGAGALLLAGYSRYKQSKSESRQQELMQKQERLEDRIERKEELQELADKISDVSDWLSELESGMYALSLISQKNEQYPSVDRIWWNRTVQLCKDALAYRHSVGYFPAFSLSVHYFGEMGEKIPVEDSREAIQTQQRPRMPAIVLEIDDDVDHLPEEQSFTFLHESLDGLGKYRQRKAKISEEDWNLFNEFSSITPEQIEDLLDDIAVSLFSEAIESGPKIEFDPEEFETVEQMAAYICSDTIAYEGLDGDLEEMRELIEELETVEKEIRLTSYS
ncbi:hypothetical protein [Halorubrum sp. AS12]|uniref:hypothetical protein n=1 Tax=Halorubrum sp. AS12 TaxID=3409687 RepID=UPI003DA732E2